ncbi:MAG: transposase [Lewinellaceae bacterium]|nr:transposase [Lewinellaceae bacterium]MCB9294460.1 transposase [Lewinellaceae bacterium]
MTKRERKELESIKIDSLHAFLAKQFRGFTDNRDDNLSITMQDALMSGYAVFSLKYPSLLQFNNERTAREENLRTVYKVKKAPSDSGMRGILDEVELKEMQGLYPGLSKKLRRAGLLRAYQYINGHIAVSIDGVHHYSSEKVKCEQCLECTKSNGIKEYRHSLLSAVITHPEKKTVLPLAHEPIVKQDGNTKNDCETNAAKRLVPQIRQLLPKEKVAIVEDALSANGPHIRALKKERFRFVISVKPDGNKYLFGLFERLGAQGKINEHEWEEGQHIHQFRYVNGLPLNSDNRDIKVNFLDYRQIDIRGKEKDKRFTWITDFHLNKHSVYKVMRTGRGRWKIENETFNTLKNLGYNFEHNYGHGQKNLCTVLALLMMLAFLVDQLQQGWNELFQAAWHKTQTKVALWEKVRQKFNEYTVASMEVIYKLIIGLLKVRYEIIEDSG